MSRAEPPGTSVTEVGAASPEPEPDPAGASVRRRSRGRAVVALRHSDFRLLFLGQAVSQVGDGAFYVVIGWYVYSLHRSSSAVATVFGAAAVATLASLLVGGALADKFDKKRVMVATDTARAVLLAGLALLVGSHRASLAAIVVVVTLMGLLDGLFSPAFNAIVPSLVSDASLESANGLMGFTRATAGVVGPMLGGVLYAAFRADTVLWFDAVSFAVAGITAAAIRRTALARAAPAPAAEGPDAAAGEEASRWNPLRDIVDGTRYVIGVPLLASIPIAALAIMVAEAPTQALLPDVVNQRFDGTVWTISALTIALGLGTAFGGIAYGHFQPRRSAAILVFLAWAASHALCALAFLQGSVAIATGLFALRGFLGGFGGGIWGTLLMRTVPADKLSRVFSIDTFGCSLMLPIGYALTGWLVTRLDVTSAIFAAVGQVMAAVLMAALLLKRGIREASA